MTTGFGQRPRPKADRIRALVETLTFLEGVRDDKRALTCQGCADEVFMPVQDKDRLSATRQIPLVLERLEKLGWVEALDEAPAEAPAPSKGGNVVEFPPRQAAPRVR